MKISIIGLGQVGEATFSAMEEKLRQTLKNDRWMLFGVDLNFQTLDVFKKKYKESPVVGGFDKNIPSDSDVYIISVYSCEQVQSVLNALNHPYVIRPLVIIESTISPDLAMKIKENSFYFDLALFPHRFNPNDPEHAVFNLNRVLGGIDENSTKRAINFYRRFMAKKRMIVAPFEIVTLTKPMENAYRFIEIAIAEDFKMECNRLGINFNELRTAMNSKWNIDLKEARGGVGGKCLPKDTNFIATFFTNSSFIKTALEVDKKYRISLGGVVNE